MDYTTLVANKATAGSISSWLSNDAVTAFAPEIVTEATLMIYRSLRSIYMLTKSSGVMTVGNDYIPLQDDYMQVKSFWVTGTQQQRMAFKTEEFVKSLATYDGAGVQIPQQPTCFFLDKDNYNFDSPADLAYPWQIWYYAEPAALSDDNPTNWLTAKYPRLLRCACQLNAAEVMRSLGQTPPTAVDWIGEYEKAWQLCQIDSDAMIRATEAGAYDNGMFGATGYGGYAISFG